MSGALDAWVEKVAAHVDAERIHVCVGDDQEMAMLEVAAARRARDHEVRPRQEVASIIAARKKEDAGPDNAFLTRDAAGHRFWPRLFDSMRRETLYCVPYVLGEPDAAWAEPGMMLTNDPWFVLGFASRTRIGRAAGSVIAREGARIVRCVHASLADGAPTVCVFTETRTIWALGVGGDAVLEGRPHALRLATSIVGARERVAAKIAIVEVSAPDGRVRAIVGVIAPSTLRQTHATLLGRPKPGTRHRVIAEVAWLTTDEEGELTALLPERPLGGASSRAAVPLDALVLCTHRANAMPLVLEIPGWTHACYAASMLVDDRFDTTEPELDPMGMRRSCGGDVMAYVERWLALGTRMQRPPKVFQLNWGIRDRTGAPLWPGNSEAWRIVDWMLGRLEGRGRVRPTVAGFVPETTSIDRSASALSEEGWQALFAVEPSEWRLEIARDAKTFAALGARAPIGLQREHRHMAERVDEIAGRIERSHAT